VILIASGKYEATNEIAVLNKLLAGYRQKLLADNVSAVGIQ
jgi:hypothetical protein